MHSLAAAGAVELAHLPPFRLGPLLVEPALRRLAGRGGEARVIQPLAMRVLLALTDAQGETSSRDDLVSTCWNQRIVGDDAVHRIISTLRRDLAHLSGGAVSIETIAKVGYRLRVEAEPEAGKPDVTATSRSDRWRRLWPAFALLAVGLLATVWFVATRAGADGDITAIAVMPEGELAGVETARFADGLTDDLARLSSTMPSLAFVEPNSGNSQGPLLLRVALDADADRPAARVRLVDRKGGAVVWSREFVAQSGSTIELRERVANGVTGVVQCGLDRAAEFDDPVGLRLYLGACEGLETGDFERARTFALQITEFRPNAPAGWACLANTTIFAAADTGSVNASVIATAEGFARRALAADSHSGLAYLALAMAERWRGGPALDILERGLSVAPDFALLHKHYALALSDAGMVSAAVEPALRAIALQPHNPSLYRIAVAALVNAGRREEALALSEKMQGLWRYDRSVNMQRLAMLFYERDANAALATFAASPLRQEPTAQQIREALVWRTDPAAYDWSQFDRVAERVYATDAALAWTLSATAARMGDPARSLAWLRRAPPAVLFVWSPMFAQEAAALHRDPQFFDEMARMGAVARWRKSGRWPDFCSDPGLPYDCRARAARPVSEPKLFQKDLAQA